MENNFAKFKLPRKTIALDYLQLNIRMLGLLLYFIIFFPILYYILDRTIISLDNMIKGFFILLGACIYGGIHQLLGSRVAFLSLDDYGYNINKLKVFKSNVFMPYNWVENIEIKENLFSKKFNTVNLFITPNSLAAVKLKEATISTSGSNRVHFIISPTIITNLPKETAVALKEELEKKINNFKNLNAKDQEKVFSFGGVTSEEVESLSYKKPPSEWETLSKNKKIIVIALGAFTLILFIAMWIYVGLVD